MLRLSRWIASIFPICRMMSLYVHLDGREVCPAGVDHLHAAGRIPTDVGVSQHHSYAHTPYGRKREAAQGCEVIQGGEPSEGKVYATYDGLDKSRNALAGGVCMDHGYRGTCWRGKIQTPPD